MSTGPGDSVVVYGGQGDTGMLYGDVWMMHTGAGGARGEWIKPVVYGDVPPARAAHAAAVSGMRLFVFAGQTMDPISGNVRPDYTVHFLHLSSLTWGGAASPPTEMGLFRRFGHQAVGLKDGEIVLVGGGYAPKSSTDTGAVPVNVTFLGDAAEFRFLTRPRTPPTLAGLSIGAAKKLQPLDPKP